MLTNVRKHHFGVSFEMKQIRNKESMPDGNKKLKHIYFVGLNTTVP